MCFLLLISISSCECVLNAIYVFCASDLIIWVYVECNVCVFCSRSHVVDMLECMFSSYDVCVFCFRSHDVDMLECMFSSSRSRLPLMFVPQISSCPSVVVHKISWFGSIRLRISFCCLCMHHLFILYSEGVKGHCLQRP